MCNLYKQIEMLCKNKGIRIADLARDTELSKTTFSDLKNGRAKSLSMDKLIIVADYFDISLDELVGRKRTTPDTEISEVVERLIKLTNAMTPEQCITFVQTAEALILPNAKE